MATLVFKFLANDAGLKDGINQAKGHLDDFDGKATSIGANIGKTFALLGGALAAAGIVTALKDMAIAAQEDEVAQKLLATQLRNTTGATDDQIAKAEDFITATSKMAGVADDVLRPALANAVRGTGDLGTAQDLLKVALDGAAASGKPLETVMQALIKAHNGNETALYKLAPQLKATGGGIDDFAKSVEGAAKASANPFEKFKISIDEAKEALGARLLPILGKLVDKLMPIIEQLIPTFGAVIDALVPVIDALIPVVVMLIEDLLPLVPILLDLIKALLPIITELLPPLIDLFMALIPVITPLVEILTSFLVPIIKVVVTWLKTIITWVGNMLDAFAPVGDGIKAAFTGVAKFFKSLINGWIDLFEGFVNGVINGINGIIGALNLVGKYGPIKFQLSTLPGINIPKLASGGIVMPTPGGSIVNVAEAGKPEAIIPLDRLGALGGGTTVNIYVNQAVTAQTIIDVVNKYSRNTGVSSSVLFA
jgi:hypothetical protein